MPFVIRNGKVSRLAFKVVQRAAEAAFCAQPSPIAARRHPPCSSHPARVRADVSTADPARARLDCARIANAVLQFEFRAARSALVAGERVSGGAGPLMAQFACGTEERIDATNVCLPVELRGVGTVGFVHKS